jgi:AcrR family transcriptional regulator
MPPSRRPISTDESDPPTAVGLKELRRAQRFETSRNQILDIAEELFGDNGYAGTSLEQVAAGAEFSVGALYRFFDNKAALLESVLRRRGSVLLSGMESAAQSPGTGEERLLRICSSVIEFFRTCPAFCRISMRVYTVNLEVLPELDWLPESRGAAMDIYAGAIEQGQREGDLRPGDPNALAHLVSALVTAHHLLDPPLTGLATGVDLDEILEIIRGAMRAPRDRPAATARRRPARD